MPGTSNTSSSKKKKKQNPLTYQLTWVKEGIWQNPPQIKKIKKRRYLYSRIKVALTLKETSGLKEELKQVQDV